MRKGLYCYWLVVAILLLSCDDSNVFVEYKLNESVFNLNFYCVEHDFGLYYGIDGYNLYPMYDLARIEKKYLYQNGKFYTLEEAKNAVWEKEKRKKRWPWIKHTPAGEAP